MHGGCIPGNNDPSANCHPGQKRSPAGDSCNKKNPCPAGQKFESAANGCVPDKQSADDQKKKADRKKKQEERKQKKDKLVKETIPRKKDAYNKKLRDEQKKKEDEQKTQRAEKKKQLTEKPRGKKRFEFQRNRKRTRMGKCLLLVPLSVYGSIEGISSEDYLIDFFSEEFVFSEAIDELWPGDFLVPLDVDIDNEDYMKFYVEIAAQVEDDRDTRWKPKEPIGVKRDGGVNVPEKLRRTPFPIPTTTDLTVGVHRYDKRNPLLFIARIIAQFAGRLGQIGIQVAGIFASVAERVGLRLANLNARGGARLAKKGATRGGDAMSKGGRAVSKSKNWRNCLNGAKPVK